METTNQDILNLATIINKYDESTLNIFQNKILPNILETHENVINSLHETKMKLESKNEMYIETLIIKLIFASNSALKLSLGSKMLSIKNKFFDFSSIQTLARSVIECFLTLEYLYFSNISKEEQQIRFELWVAAGYKSRQYLMKLKINNEKYRQQFEREKDFIKKTNEKIKNTPFYKKFKNKNLLWRLNRFGLPRGGNNWSDLIKQGILNDSFFFTTLFSLF